MTYFIALFAGKRDCLPYPGRDKKTREPLRPLVSGHAQSRAISYIVFLSRCFR